MRKPDASALHVLIGLLEAPALAVTHATVEYHGRSGWELVETGLLVPAGHGNAIIDEDDDDRPRSVGHEAGRGLGYQSSATGWRTVDQEMLVLYEPALTRFFELLFVHRLSIPRQGPRPLDETKRVWDIGTAHVGSRNCSIWFARRLAAEGSAAVLTAAHNARPPGDMRVILTSTARERFPAPGLARGTVVPIADAVSAIDDTRVDMAMLEARVAGRPAEPIISPVLLSADDRTLFIHGESILSVGGTKQRRLLRLLVDAHRNGEPIRAAVMLEKADLSGNSLDKAFGKHWQTLREHLQPSGGIWRFVV